MCIAAEGIEWRATETQRDLVVWGCLHLLPISSVTSFRVYFNISASKQISGQTRTQGREPAEGAGPQLIQSC